MFLTGFSELSLDGKNRLSVSQSIREKINPDEHGRGFYVLPGDLPGTLALYPNLYFEKRRQAVPSYERMSPELVRWRQWELSMCFPVDPDNQGRIVIPERLLKRAGIGKEITLLGVQDHLEIWNRADYDAFQESIAPDYPKHRAAAMEELRRIQDSNSPAAAARGPGE